MSNYCSYGTKIVVSLDITGCIMVAVKNRFS